MRGPRDEKLQIKSPVKAPKASRRAPAHGIKTKLSADGTSCERRHTVADAKTGDPTSALHTTFAVLRGAGGACPSTPAADQEGQQGKRRHATLPPVEHTMTEVAASCCIGRCAACTPRPSEDAARPCPCPSLGFCLSRMGTSPALVCVGG